MKTGLTLAFGICCSILFSEAAPQPDIYSSDYWEIRGAPSKTTWVEIHNPAQAQKTGIAHVSVIARKKGGPAWEIEWVWNHIAITTEALKRSVLRPYKTRGTYPERFNEAYEAYEAWKKEEKMGKATVCSTSIEDFLAAAKFPPVPAVKP